MAFPDWLLQAIKLPPKLMIPVFIVSGMLVLLPNAALTILGLDLIRNQYRAWAGLFFIGSFAILCTHLAYGLRQFVTDLHEKHKAKRRLHNLTYDEKKLLQYFLLKKTRTRKLNIDSGVAEGLAGIGIIARASNVGSFHAGFACNIADFAFDYLNRHPHLLDTPGDNSLPTAFN